MIISRISKGVYMLVGDGDWWCSLLAAVRGLRAFFEGIHGSPWEVHW